MDNEYESLLIGRIKSGEKASFEMLLKIFEKRVYNIAFGYSKNYDDAMDISQETFIRIYKSIKTFRQDSALSTWIYKITVNAAYDFIKKQKSNNTVSLETIAEKAVSSNTVEGIYEKKETHEAIWQAINLLSEEHREAIILRDINGLTYEDIANTLDLELGTVKSRICRARIALRDIIKKEI